MKRTIDFDDKASSETEKIHNIGADRDLASKSKIFKLLASQ